MPALPRWIIAVLGLAGILIGNARAEESVDDSLAAQTGLGPRERAELTAEFRQEIWPLLNRTSNGQKSCVQCHRDGPDNSSPLILLGDPEEDFLALLGYGYFDEDYPLSLLAKITHKTRKYRMPPEPANSWTDEEIAQLRSFIETLNAQRRGTDISADEMFPAELLADYEGEPGETPSGNTFLSYWQLRKKIQTIFQDDWKRDERDLFQENLAQFGGADFVRRFDESTKATPSFLSALDALASDVASKAYLNGTGPFQGLEIEGHASEGNEGLSARIESPSASSIERSFSATRPRPNRAPRRPCFRVSPRDARPWRRRIPPSRSSFSLRTSKGA